MDKSQGNRDQLAAGDLLQDRYQIQEVIGVGGMGTVYRARDTNFKAIRLVAIKEMISQINDPVVRKNIYGIYERESNILATLRHQSIPRIYDYFVINDRVYLVMEFINGRDLDDILSETTTFFSEEQVMGWAIELCDVIAYLHAIEPEPIIFRDMKPSNIMVNLQNHIVLVDFGIAKLFENRDKNTMVGTQGYSPPDQYRGEATPKVDIYALGATLHHLVTLKDPRLEPPFSFGERPIREINPNLSEELASIIDKALSYNSEDRFESIEEMKEALLNAARKTGTLPEGALMGRPSVSAKSGIKPIWVFECEDEIRGTPNYHQGVLYVGCYDNNLYALDAANGEFRWKYPTDGGLPGRPAVMDNTVFVGSEDHRMHAISTRTGSVVWTYFTEGPVRSSPRIAQGHVFIGSDDGFLHAVNQASGRVAWKTDAGGMVRSTPFVSDEFVYIGTEAGEVLAMDYRGESKWRFRAKRAVTSSPVVKGDTLFVGSMDGTLYALDANTGWVIWRYRLGKGTISTPLVVDNLVVVGAIDNVVYGVDTHSGKEVWRFTTEHQVTGSAIVFKDAIYIGSVDGHLYSLDSSNGHLRWKFQTLGHVTGTPTAHEDMIYFGSTDKMVYALLA
jgi:outer membrane protein assembly factor BamB